MPKRTTKSKLESHPFIEYVLKVWGRNSSYAAAYLRSAALVRPKDGIFDELIFLSHIKKNTS